MFAVRKMVLSLISLIVVVSALVFLFPRAQKKNAFAEKGLFIILLIYLGVWYSNTVIPAFFHKLEALQKRKLSYNNFTKRMDVLLLKGKLSLNDSAQQLNVDKNPGNSQARYTYMPRSVDRNGIEMTYTFWLHKPDNSTNLDGRTLFLKGSKDKTTTFTKGQEKQFDVSKRKTNIALSENKNYYKMASSEPVYFNDSGTEYIMENVHWNTRLVKSPLVRFASKEETSGGSNYKDYLVVEFNTLQDPHKKMIIGGEDSQFNLMDGHSIWGLISIIFRNTRDYAGFINGFQVTIMLDDSHVKTDVFENETLRLNHGPLYILPDGDTTTQGGDTGSIADIRYFNYAITQPEIQRILERGPTLERGEVGTDEKDRIVRRNDFNLLNELKLG